MKSGPEREAIITRLQPSGQWWRWYNDGYAADAIIVHLNKMATLSSIGLYGTKTVREISVQIDIFNDQCQNIFTKDTAFLCTGSADPIQVPVYVPMLAGKYYTVCAELGDLILCIGDLDLNLPCISNRSFFRPALRESVFDSDIDLAEPLSP